MDLMRTEDRRTEWFVPSVGPLKLRMCIGLLFLPYTGMVLAYTVIGSMMAEHIHWDRVGAIVVIYFLALGVGGHALDALGSTGPKPWGSAFSRRGLVALAALSIVGAYSIGIYYMVVYTPLLWLIAIPEGFFLLAYNLEWFHGRFHTDAWFGISWGGLPVLAGYVLQTNQISVAALMVAASMALLSLVEIKASRPYKMMKRACAADGKTDEPDQVQGLEAILKSVSLGIILLGAGLLTWRLSGS